MALNLSEEAAEPLDVVTVGRLVLQYVVERKRLGQLTGQSPTTVRYHLWLFAEHIGSDRPPAYITTRRIERWLLDCNISIASKRIYLSNVRTFCTWLVRHGYLRHNPAALIDRPRQPHLLPPRALTREQVAAIYRECPDVRAELIVTLQVQEGLRAGGVAALEVGDVDLGTLVVAVTEKGGNQRALPITTECERVLCRYLAEAKLTAGPLVRNQRFPNRGVSATTVARIVGKAMHAAGIDESSHALRHTFASDLVDRGVNIRTVQYLLGHRSISSSQRYFRRYVGDLRDAMEGRTYR